jgi:hypothetical protein
MTERRAHDAFERLGLVRITAEGAAETRMVENERRADDRNAARKRTLELEPEPPPLRCRRLEQGIGTGGAQHLCPCSPDERSRSSVQHGLGRGDNHDDVGAHERRVDA